MNCGFYKQGHKFHKTATISKIDKGSNIQTETQRDRADGRDERKKISKFKNGKRPCKRNKKSRHKLIPIYKYEEKNL